MAVREFGHWVRPLGIASSATWAAVGRTDRGRTTTIGRTDGRTEDDDGDRTDTTGRMTYIYI